MDSDVVKELFLPSREKCFELIRRVRWPGGVVKCIHCGGEKVYSDGHTRKGAKKYLCVECGKYFNDLSKTIFENRKFAVEELFYIVKEMGYKTTKEISEELGRSYSAVLNFIHEVQNLAGKIEGGIEDVIEMDEVYVYAGAKGLKKEP